MARAERLTGWVRAFHNHRIRDWKLMIIMSSGLSHFAWLDSPLVRIIAMSKRVYTLTESDTNWTLFNSNESFSLNSTSVGLTDKCLVPLFNQWSDRTGRDEITVREPQYVFAVNVCLMADRHSEVDDVVHCLTN
jgi:hypothetical protein